MCSTSANRDFFNDPQVNNSLELFEQPFSNGLLKPHSYQMTSGEVDRIFLRPIYKKVINSNEFQRLKNINFLGSIDYVVNPEHKKNCIRVISIAWGSRNLLFNFLDYVNCQKSKKLSA